MAYITGNNQIYIYGLWMTNKIATDNPHIIDSPDGREIVNLACGYHYTAFITSTGNLYTLGSSNYGELGRDIDEIFSLPDKPVIVERLRGIKIVQLSCGLLHMGAIDNKGNVYLWGAGRSGQLGGPAAAVNPFPLLNDYIKHAKQIECRNNSTLILTKEGKVYGSGINSFGQLGAGIENYEMSNLTLILGLPPIKQISLGSRHSAFLTEKGEVYTCGDNVEGQLGRRTDSVINTRPVKINSFPNIDQIACGNDYTSFLTNKGEVYVCGNNKGKRLGITGDDKIYIPEKIPSLSKVKQITRGDNNLAVIM